LLPSWIVATRSRKPWAQSSLSESTVGRKRIPTGRCGRWPTLRYARCNGR
jgi:hypothetical protein